MIDLKREFEIIPLSEQDYTRKIKEFAKEIYLQMHSGLPMISCPERALENAIESAEIYVETFYKRNDDV